MNRPLVEVLVTPGCPRAEEARDRVAEVAGRLGLTEEVEVVEVASREDALELGFPGSPTVRVDGREVEPDPPSASALACRTYGGQGAPATWMIEAAIVRALAPRHILFLCVANSARSQIAEALARAYAPEGMRISSAGSDPTSVREEVGAVMAEIGVDVRSHRSKGTEEVKGPVDVVITLCAEEVCPTWLGDVRRLHWPFPDPAGVEGTAEDRLDAFRRVRDRLGRRIQALVGREPGT